MQYSNVKYDNKKEIIGSMLTLRNTKYIHINFRRMHSGDTGWVNPYPT